MRFLVMSNPQYDLVIGARSIAKHSLLSPPNFGVNGVVVYKADTGMVYGAVTRTHPPANLYIDEEATNLKGIKKKLDNDLISLRRDLRNIKRDTPGSTDEIAKKEIEIKEKEEEVEKAAKVLKEYDEKHPKT